MSALPLKADMLSVSIDCPLSANNELPAHSIPGSGRAAPLTFPPVCIAREDYYEDYHEDYSVPLVARGPTAHASEEAALRRWVEAYPKNDTTPRA